MTKLFATGRSVAGDAQSADKAALDHVLARIAELAPMIVQLVPEMEQGGRLPEKLVQALRSAGIYRMAVPRRYSGLGLAPPDSFRAVTALARIDASVGWNAMIGHATLLFPFQASQDFCEAFFRNGADRIVAGSGQPAGKAERVPGGWRVTGVWPFASGCQSADWIGGLCVMTENGVPIAAPGGRGPMMRYCLLPAGEWDIRDTWHTLGLRGTGSHHVALTDAFVPDANFFEFMFGESFAPDHIFTRFPEIMLLGHSALALGVAEGAIADLVDIARSGARQMFMMAPLAETERFKEGLGRLDVELKAARALFEAEVARVWSNPERSTAKGLPRVADQLQVGTWVTAACLRVVEGCFELAGSRAVYESSPLQRRLRDLHAATTHVAVHPRQYILAGDLALARLAPENVRENALGP